MDPLEYPFVQHALLAGTASAAAAGPVCYFLVLLPSATASDMSYG